MDAQTFLHKHYLLYDEYKNQETCCNQCNKKINGWAFSCESCAFWLHKSCAIRPLNISHPVHNSLCLKIRNWDFICDKCSTLSRGYVFKNQDSPYKLDAICALSTKDQTCEEERPGNKIQHFSHSHSLILFNYRKVRKYEYCCNWCEKPLSGMSYGCFKCRFEQFFLHRLCLNKMPSRIMKHPFHPSHPLYLNSNVPNSFCNACKDQIFENGYSCHSCCFHIHVLCAKLKPTLRHDECHPMHNLTYIFTTASLQCNKCGVSYKAKDWEKRAFSRCVECNFNIHFECLVPTTTRNIYHRHSLIATSSFIEDYSGVYYCDICEKHRNPKGHFYCCDECKFVAHIECVLDKVANTRIYYSSTSSLKQEESQAIDENFPNRRLIEHLNHKHPLRFKEVIRTEKHGNEQFNCQACEQEVWDTHAYLCQRKGCNYYVHKVCAELSFELLHPFHSKHPLILQTRSNPWAKIFICDKCQDISNGLMYCCFVCNIKLDIKCVVNQEVNKIERPILLHFIHHHELLPAKCSTSRVKSFKCQACFTNISGPAYCCLRCFFYIHESCLSKLPLEIQIPYHLLHPLIPFVTDTLAKRTCCLACKSDCYGIYFACFRCDIYFHFSCACSLKRPMSSNSHPHDLYLFQRDKLKIFNKISKCGKCNKFVTKESVYRCIDCDINFHLKCAGVPYKVRSKCHVHPLTLKNSFIEDDSGEYYCDACEEERNPKDDLYYCQECDGMCATHIDCLISKVEDVLQQ